MCQNRLHVMEACDSQCVRFFIYSKIKYLYKIIKYFRVFLSLVHNGVRKHSMIPWKWLFRSEMEKNQHKCLVHTWFLLYRLHANGFSVGVCVLFSMRKKNNSLSLGNDVRSPILSILRVQWTIDIGKIFVRVLFSHMLNNDDITISVSADYLNRH